MNYRKFFKWLTFDMIVFAVANIYLVWNFQERFGVLNELSYFKLIVLGLAVYRAANILSNETITKPIRAPFVNETHKDGKIVEQPKSSGFAGAMGLLIFCPSCTGVWIAAAMTYCYIFFPGPTFLIALFLALSGMERLLSAAIGYLKQNS